MQNNDSLDKIIDVYFACLTTEPFEYKGKTYEPKELYVSPLLLRGFTCPANCGGCCFRVTLCWIPSEARPDYDQIRKREVVFNRRVYDIYTDDQEDVESPKCRNLRWEDGRCLIHGKHPMPCDFELMKFLISKSDKRYNQFTQKLFGRGWNLKRVDGGVGAKCEMTPITQETIEEVLRKLDRIEAWTNYFQLNTKIPAIREWITKLDTTQPLLLTKEGKFNGYLY